MLDVEASLRALRESPKSGVDPDKIVLFGRSLGGAVALAGADRFPEQVRTGASPRGRGLRGVLRDGEGGWGAAARSSLVAPQSFSLPRASFVQGSRMVALSAKDCPPRAWRRILVCFLGARKKKISEVRKHCVLSQGCPLCRRVRAS